MKYGDVESIFRLEFKTKIIIAAYNCVPGTIVTKAGFQK